MRARNHAATAKCGKNDQADPAEGGDHMNKKWTRYIAMGIALLLAVVMLLTLVVPYIGL